MTAHATATHVLGRAVALSALAMSETDTRSVIALTETGKASETLEDMAAALKLELVAIRSFHELPFKLHHHRPIAVVLELSPTAQSCRSALRCIAAYDPATHILMTSGEDPAVLGEIDVYENLWGLTGLHRMAGPPAPAELIGFLFGAGRHHGFGQLMPVA
jgi:hypothetical protein